MMKQLKWLKKNFSLIIKFMNIISKKLNKIENCFLVSIPALSISTQSASISNNWNVNVIPALKSEINQKLFVFYLPHVTESVESKTSACSLTNHSYCNLQGSLFCLGYVRK